MVEQSLYQLMEELIRLVPSTFYRYNYSDLDWEGPLTGLVGPRGVGKSTMLLQYIKEHRNSGHHLYVSADHAYFSHTTLIDLADEFVKDGGSHLYIDEIHKYDGWARELKQIFDTHPALKVTFSGSSVLDILKGEADLSRRAVIEHLQGLSFREYLELFHNVKVPVFSLDDILGQKVEIPELPHPLPYFRSYLKEGYYPFALMGHFSQRMLQIVNQTVEVDIPQYADMKATTARKLKELLVVVAGLAPVKPNADNLAREIGVSKNNVPEYLIFLEKAGMLGQLRDDTQGLISLGKVQKIYVDNPSLMTVLANGNPNIGNLRETFFFNQMREKYAISSSRESDFKIEKYTFEIGGMKKGSKQIAGIPNGIIVRDDIEYGHGNVVPLWHFGFTY
ncbi:MAG: ATP-binding protein [Bacteroidales bacterium]|nr:ATP-binding protein [Bacteroidales bacterium]MBQ7489556.1 ATP-binding protein [Bacteroidales bacterium]